MPDPFAGQPEWSPRPPRPVVPVPAAAVDELRGRRVIVGLPGLGWRADLRADERVVRGSRTYIPTIPEQEWYRAETEQVEVFAPLAPAERVWVEQLGEASATVRELDKVLPRLVSLDAPPRRDPVPVVQADAVCGRRVVQVVNGVERRDLRAVTEVYTDDEGDICIRVATEADWYRWTWTGQTPRTLAVPVHLAWLE